MKKVKGTKAIARKPPARAKRSAAVQRFPEIEGIARKDLLTLLSRDACCCALAKTIRDAADDFIRRHCGKIVISDPNGGGFGPGGAPPGIFTMSGATLERTPKKDTLTPTGQPSVSFTQPTESRAQVVASLASLPGARIELSLNPLVNDLLFEFVPSGTMPSPGTTHASPTFVSADTATARVTFQDAGGASFDAFLADAATASAMVRALSIASVDAAQASLKEDSVANRYVLRYKLS